MDNNDIEKPEWKLIHCENTPPLIPIDEFSALDLYKWMVAGELEWEYIPTAKQNKLIDCQLVDKDGNILPRIQFIRYESRFL